MPASRRTPATDRPAAPPVVGVVVNNVGGYSRAVIRGIASFGFARNWNTRVVGINEGATTRLTHDYNGLIVQFGVEELRELATRSRAPVVNVSSALTQYPAPSVVTDDRAVGRLGAEHLLRFGHRHLIFYRPDDRQFADLRQAGFCERCAEAGRAGETVEVIRDGPTLSRRLRHGPLPVAVMGSNDRVALRAVELCRALGRDCPGDVAVLGVDNDDLAQSLANPPMSTINTARERIGYEAAALLQRVMDGEEVPADRVTLVPPHGVIARRSTDALAVGDAVASEAARFVLANAARRIGVDDVANHVAVSRRQLERRFRAAFGRSVHEELHRCRIERASRLLLETDLTLGQVADASGFASTSYFITSFRRAVGQSPGRYRDRNAVGS